MKTKDNLLKGIIIGVCGIILPLILMGTSTTSNEIGRYQISTGVYQSGQLMTSIFETTIDTKTGEVISRKRVNIKGYKK